jgi:recombinational DNA repair protein RecR
MSLQEEFDYFENQLIKYNRVEHIKQNYSNCSVCKNVADLHNMCSKRNEKVSATLFIESVKDYIKKYPSQT